MENKVFWGVIGALVIGFVALIIFAKQSDTTVTRNDIKTIQGLKEVEKKDRNHVQTAVQYPESPAMGGNHNPVWVGCNGVSYGEPVQNEKAVHALEHGAVWVTYQPTLKQSEIDTLESKVKSSVYTFSSPYSEQTSPIVLTAWGKQLAVNDTSDARLEQFLIKFRKGEQTPEPGATCASPGGAM